MPAPLGMILTGMALTNINAGHIIRGLPATWSKEIRAIALSIIFLRSGLEIELKVLSSSSQCTGSDNVPVSLSSMLVLFDRDIQQIRSDYRSKWYLHACYHTSVWWSNVRHCTVYRLWLSVLVMLIVT